MRNYGYSVDPWASVFPEVALYDATPASGSNYYCAGDRMCPMVSSLCVQNTLKTFRILLIYYCFTRLLGTIPYNATQVLDLRVHYR
jgi:hypothetical protein